MNFACLPYSFWRLSDGKPSEETLRDAIMWLGCSEMCPVFAPAWDTALALLWLTLVGPGNQNLKLAW